MFNLGKPRNFFKVYTYNKENINFNQEFTDQELFKNLLDAGYMLKKHVKFHDSPMTLIIDYIINTPIFIEWKYKDNLQDSNLNIKARHNCAFYSFPSNCIFSVENDCFIHASRFSTVIAGNRCRIDVAENSNVKCKKDCYIKLGENSTANVADNANIKINGSTNIVIKGSGKVFVDAKSYGQFKYFLKDISIICDSSLEIATNPGINIYKMFINCGDKSKIIGDIQGSVIICGKKSKIKVGRNTIVIAGPGSEVHNLSNHEVLVINSKNQKSIILNKYEIVAIPEEDQEFIKSISLLIKDKVLTFAPEEIDIIKKTIYSTGDFLSNYNDVTDKIKKKLF